MKSPVKYSGGETPPELAAGTAALRRKESAQLIERVAIFERKLQETIGAHKFKLFANVRAVRFNRAGTDKKFSGNFLGGFAQRYALQDALFGNGQVVEARFVRRERFRAAAAAEEKIGKRRAHISFVSRYGGNAI